MHRVHPALGLMLLVPYCLLLAGCGGEPEPAVPQPRAHDHDHGHHHGEPAASYGEAVNQVESMNREIREAWAEGDLDKADGPIHEVPHVLDNLPQLAEDHGLDAEAVAEIRAATDRLFDAFERLDLTIHGGEGAQYDEVVEQIDQALATLREHADEE